MHNVICNSVCEGIWQLVKFFGKLNLALFLNWACYNIYVNMNGLKKKLSMAVYTDCVRDYIVVLVDRVCCAILSLSYSIHCVIS